MSNAPVSTASFPDAGSEAYVGLANAMELAMDELSTIFPEMLQGETKSSNRCEGLRVLKQQHLMSPVIYNEWIVVATRLNVTIAIIIGVVSIGIIPMISRSDTCRVVYICIHLTCFHTRVEIMTMTIIM